MKTYDTPRRIRILFNGHYIADTVKALFVWEHPYFPQYYLPKEAFKSSYIEEGDQILNDQNEQVANIWRIKVGDRSTDQAICFVDELKGAGHEVAGLVKANFADMGILPFHSLPLLPLLEMLQSHGLSRETSG